MTRPRRVPVFLLLALLLAACGPAAPQRPSQDLPTPAAATPIFGPDDAPDPDVPIAASAEVGAFVWQTDGVYGYRMLRPADWELSDSGYARTFSAPPAAGQPVPMRLHVINMTARPATEPWGGPGGFLTMFAPADDIAGWTARLEQYAFNPQEKAPLPADLAREAVVYIQQADDGNGRRIFPFAFKVSAGQPLVLALEGNVGPYEFDDLQASGVWDDFVTMLRSLTALPIDAANVTPWAPTATPTATEPPRTPLPTSPPVTASSRYEYTPQPVPVATPLDPRLIIWPALDAFEQELSRVALGPQLANRVCEWAMLTDSTDPYYVWAVCMAYDGAPNIARVSRPAVIRVDPANGVTVQVPREGADWAGDVMALFPADAQTKIFAQAIQPIIPKMIAHARLRLKWPGLPPLAAAAFEPPAPYSPGAGASVSLYSGRPDPTWTLTRLELARLDELLRDLPAGQCPAPFDGLGYRGVVVGLGGMGDAGNLRTTNGYVWSGDLGRSADAFCFVDTDRSVERFLLSSAIAHTDDPALRELLAELGGPLPTPMVTPSPTPTVAPGFVWWGDEGLGIEFYLPDRWELAAQTNLSRLWRTKTASPAAASAEPAPFWFTLLPPNYPYEDSDAYNYWTPEEINRAWATPIGGTFTTPHAPDGYNLYTRLSDMTVDGFPAAVLSNAAAERRVLVRVGGLTVMFGAYGVTEEDRRAFETVLRSVKFGGLITLSGAAALTPQP